MNKAKKKTIAYINFSPYENSGNILDFLQENFSDVILFSLRFHEIKGKRHTNEVSVYKNGNLIKTYNLFQIPIAPSLLFILLPIRSATIMVQIVFYIIFFKIKFKKIDYYFTVNAFTAWIGIILERLKAVDKTVFWVWDYYPPIHENKIVMLMRWIYWQFDKAATHSDKIVFLNERLESLRKDIGILPKHKQFQIVPIGTNSIKRNTIKKSGKINLVFLGVLKKSQGLEIVFRTGNDLVNKFKNIELHIIGSGPDEDYFKRIAKKSKIKTTFYGYVSENKKINEILVASDIGIACYIPDPSNVSYYGDPSKIKFYLCYGIPVITTNVFVFSQEIEKEKAGIVINYKNPEQLINAINHIMRNHQQFKNNALKLSKKYYFRKIYKQMFT